VADLGLQIGASLLEPDVNERLNRSTRRLSVLIDSFQSQRAMASQGTVASSAPRAGSVLPGRGTLERLVPARRGPPPAGRPPAARTHARRAARLVSEGCREAPLAARPLPPGIDPAHGAGHRPGQRRPAPARDQNHGGAALDSSVTTARHLLASRLADLQHARDDISTFAAEAGRWPRTSPRWPPARLPGLLPARARRGLPRAAEGGRGLPLERGVGRSLATTWLPRSRRSPPRSRSDGRRLGSEGADGLASLKLCSAVPAASATSGAGSSSPSRSTAASWDGSSRGSRGRTARRQPDPRGVAGDAHGSGPGHREPPHLPPQGSFRLAVPSGLVTAPGGPAR